MVNGAFSSQQLNRRFRHFSPSLAALLASLTRGMTVSDFGAGVGLYVAHMRSWGLWATGYDGTPGIAGLTGGLVQEANLAEPCCLPITQAVVSIEVGEHIPPDRHDVFVDNLCRHATQLICLSWAVREQPGRNHVNCRNPDELVPDFRSRGWFVQHAATADARRLAGSPFSRKLLLFRKTDEA